MSRPDSASKLRELRGAAERIGATLVDLELDPSRQMLEAGALVGRTAERWGEGRNALAELWRRQGLLEATLKRADRARGQELADLLFGASIELAGPDVPVIERALLPGDTPGERCTPEQLLDSMSALFEAVKASLGEITQAWDVLLPRLDDGRRRLALAASLADDLGAQEHARLATADEAVRRLGECVSGDPLSVTTSEVEHELSALDAVVAELEGDAELKQSLDLRIRAARQQLDRITAAIDDAAGAAENLGRKIAGVTAPEVPASPGDLVDRLDAIVATAGDGGWHAARRQLEAWSADADARLRDAEAASAACRAPIRTRNEFRALLDAYAVKAKRLGLAEEPDLAAIFDQAHDELYTAPTDVALAAELIRRYQRALTGVPETPEVKR